MLRRRTSPYSVDIRWRIVWQRLSKDLTFAEIAERLNVSISTVHRIYQRFIGTSAVDPTSRKIPRPHIRLLGNDLESFVVGYVLEHPDIYLCELRQRVENVFGVRASISTLYRVLRRHGITYKKMQQVALQRSLRLRGEFMATIMMYKKEQFVWLDETGTDNRTYMRRYGYAIRGDTPRYHRSLNRGNRISVITALSTDGLVAMELINGNTDADKFFDFVRGNLIPYMNSFDGSSPKSILVLDNCSIHRVDEVLEVFRSTGIVVMFLPPYSPDYNPVEEAFSYIKYYLKRHDNLLQQLHDKTPIIKSAFKSITAQLACAWITDCGYS